MKRSRYLDKVNADYPIRKTEEEKEKFRAYVHKRASAKGAVIQTENNGNNKNIVIGDAEQAKVIFTAHYDTPAKSVFPNIMIPRNKPLFFAYQFGIIALLLMVSIGVGCMACRTSKKGVLYTPYIHTPKDVCASEENITFLSQKAIAFVDALQVNEGND